MSRKKPTSSGIVVSTGTPTGLNRIVNYISTAINVVFNYGQYPDNTQVDEPIIHVFGLADKYQNAEGKIYPVGFDMYGGTLTDPLNLLPTDRWDGLCFFDYDDPIQVDTPDDYSNTQRHWAKMTANVNIIFFFNMKRQKYYIKWGVDYRMQKETLAQRILKLLTVETPHKGGKFKVTAIVDKSIEAVYKGYTVEESKSQLNLQPYYAIRFETEIVYNVRCGDDELPPVNIVTMLQELITNSTINLQVQPQSTLNYCMNADMYPMNWFFLYPRYYEFIIIKNRTAIAFTIMFGTTYQGAEIHDFVSVAPNETKAVFVGLTVNAITNFTYTCDGWTGQIFDIYTLSYPI